MRVRTSTTKSLHTLELGTSDYGIYAGLIELGTRITFELQLRFGVAYLTWALDVHPRAARELRRALTVRREDTPLEQRIRHGR